MSHRRAIAVVVAILVLVAVALLCFGISAVMNGETGAGHGSGPAAHGQRVAATNAFE